MNILIDNWYIIVAIIGCIALGVASFIKFKNKPTIEQIDILKEELRYLVCKAENKLGGGTGQLKLRQVYDMAIAKMPWVAFLITFEEFKIYVDEALVWMQIQLETNSKIRELIEEGDIE